METKTRRIISELDYIRLMNQLSLDVGNCGTQPGLLHRLYMLLTGAQRLNPQAVTPEVVTMNSAVSLSMGRGRRKRTIRIVYPGQHEQGLVYGAEPVSIYDPVALSVFGLSRHDRVSQYVNGRQCTIRLDEIVFQPESRRLFNL
jgi:regulator of nucleoside diphosphate kinase